MKRLFYLDTISTAGTPVIRLHAGKDHYYNPDITEAMPFEIISHTIITGDLAAARTINIDLKLNDGTVIRHYTTTPNLDNNTVQLSPVLKVEDGATASTTGAVGIVKGSGWKGYRDAFIELTLSGAIDATKTMTHRILYEAYEKVTVSDSANLTTTNRHEEIGRI